MPNTTRRIPRSARNDGRSAAPRPPRFASLAVALLLALPSAGAAGAPAAAPNNGARCAVPPAVVPGTPAPAAGAPAIAPLSGTPVVAAQRRSAATPIAGEGVAATPTAAPAATADPNAALAAELTAVARALGACFSANDAAGVADLATEAYLGQLYGGGLPLPRADYLAIAPQLGAVPTDVRSVKAVERQGSDQATADVVSIVGNQLLRSRWTFVRQARSGQPDASPWRVDREDPLGFTPPHGSRQIRATLSDYAFALNATSVKGPNVILSGENTSQQDHEMLVLRFRPGLSVADLLRAAGPGLPDGVAYVGQATVPAGGRADMTLVDLAPGEYTLVCLFPDERGQPHAALGMSATFTVTR